jgi:hypothetical protein
MVLGFIATLPCKGVVRWMHYEVMWLDATHARAKTAIIESLGNSVIHTYGAAQHLGHEWAPTYR